MKDKILSGEWIEYLDNNVKVIVSKEHLFSTDTILLTNFSLPKKKERCIDLGSGSGTIPFLLRSKGYENDIVAIEIQELACDMFNRSLTLNKNIRYINIINADLKNLKGVVNFDAFDLVICNPPYKKERSGIISKKESRTTARHETKCSIEDILNISSKLLKASGRICICNRTERLVDVIYAMRKYKIEPKKIQFVQQHSKKAPKLFLIEGKKSARSGINVLPTLFIESEEMLKIYEGYKGE